jgi:hypothetical protein
VTSVFAARVICHLRRGPAQCELSEQVVPTRPRRRLARSSGDAPEPARCEPGCGKGHEEESVSATARQAQDQPGLAGRLGIKPGQVVQEIGYDDDCDEQLRDEIDALENVELVDEDYDDVVDVVLLWWRDGDGDLVEALMDALTPLADGGYIWLLTPKAGRAQHVEPSEIGEAAPTAGLSQTSSVSAARDWLGTRLVAPKARR